LNSAREAVSICNELSGATIAAKWEEAKQLASELTNRYPKNGVGYFWLGYVERKQGKYISALRHFQAAADRSPEVALAHLALGLSYAIIRQCKLFEDEMRWVMVNRPEEYLPCYYLGVYCSNDLEQFDKGTELFQQGTISPGARRLPGYCSVFSNGKNRVLNHPVWRALSEVRISEPGL